MATAENSYPLSMGSSCSQILDPKYAFQVKFQTQKHGKHTPVCTHGKYRPGYKHYKFLKSEGPVDAVSVQRFPQKLQDCSPFKPAVHSLY